MNGTHADGATVQAFYDSARDIETQIKAVWKVGAPWATLTSDGLAFGGQLYVGTGLAVSTLDAHTGGQGPNYPLPGVVSEKVNVLAAWGAVIAVAAGSWLCTLTPGGAVEPFFHLPSEGSGHPAVTWMGTFPDGRLAVAWSDGVAWFDSPGKPSLRAPTSGNLLGVPRIVGDALMYLQDRPEGPVLVRITRAPAGARVDERTVTMAGTLSLIGADTEGVYIASTSSTYTLQKFVARTLAPQWASPATLGSAPTTSVMALVETAYVGRTGGVLVTLNRHTGAVLANLTLGEEIGGELVAVAGQICATGAYRLRVYNPSTGGLSYKGGSHHKRSLGRTSSVLYAWMEDDDVPYAYALTLAARTPLFDVQMTLMQDVSEHLDRTRTKVATWQIAVGLKDQDQTPMAGETLRISADEPAEIRVNGALVSLRPGEPALLPTDGSGNVRFVLAATELCTPRLYLAGAFMPGHARVVISPNAGTNRELAEISGDSLAAKTDYQGRPILRAPYLEHPGSPDAIASSLNNLNTMDKQRRVRTARNAEWLTPRSVDAGAFTTQSLTGADGHPEVARPLDEDQPWALLIGPEAVEYREESWESLVARLGVRDPVDATIEPRRSKLWERLRSGAVTLKAVAVRGAEELEEGATALVQVVHAHGQEAWEHLKIATQEHATILGQSVLRSVSTGVGKVLEGLSFLFDWERIRALNQLTKDAVLGSLERLERQIPALKADLDAKLEGARGTIDAAFDRLRAELGNKTLNSAQRGRGAGADHQTPEELMGDPKQSWMLQKIVDTLQNGGGAASGARSGLNIPTFTIPEGVRGTLAAMAERMKTEAGKALTEALQADLDALTQIQPDQVIRGALSALATIVQGVIDVGIEAAKVLIDGLLDALAIVVGALRRWLGTEISLGFLSDLVPFALTVLDLATLPIAAVLSLLPTSRAAQTDPAGEHIHRILQIVVPLSLVISSTIAVIREGMRAEPIKGAWFSWLDGILTVFPLSTAALIAADTYYYAGSVDAWTGACFLLWTATLVLQVLQGIDPEPEVVLLLDGLISSLAACGLGICLDAWFSAEYQALDPRFVGPVAYGTTFVAILFGPARNLGDLGLSFIIVLNFAMGATAAVYTAFANDKGAREARGLDPMPAPLFLSAPTTRPSFSKGTSGQAGTAILKDVRYSVSFFDGVAETPRGPWSSDSDCVMTQPNLVMGIATDASGLSRGRRIYRDAEDRRVILVGQLDDNITTTFTDDLMLA